MSKTKLTGWKDIVTSVLVLDGLELVFFTVSCAMLFWICDYDSSDNSPMF